MSYNQIQPPVKKRYFFFFLFTSCLSCNIITGVFEKSVQLPAQEWPSGLKAEIPFDLTDTAALYNIYIVLRHTDAYHFNNMFVRMSVWEPGATNPKTGDYDLSLATNEKGWNGTAMDDIYDSRILIQPDTRFRRPGRYRVRLEQLMREDPLKFVLSVGLRVEKAAQH